jgi:hypothetical protein
MMEPLPEIPDLKIVQTDWLRPHEEMDASRLDPLIDAIGRDGRLRNPPVVAQLRGEDERYIVLDGANRTTALRQMGVPHILVQVVRPKHDSIQLRTWNQVVQSGQFEDLLDALRSLSGLFITKSDFESASEKLKAGVLLSFLGSLTDEIWEISIDIGTLEDSIIKMSELIKVAESVGSLERTGQVRASELTHFYPNMAGLIVLHNFVVEEVMIASANGMCLPSGITRFVISPRALRLNYPLEWLVEETSLKQKQAQLDDWVKRQLTNRSVRYYAESTFLFDE